MSIYKQINQSISTYEDYRILCDDYLLYRNCVKSSNLNLNNKKLFEGEHVARNKNLCNLNKVRMLCEKYMVAFPYGIHIDNIVQLNEKLKKKHAELSQENENELRELLSWINQYAVLEKPIDSYDVVLKITQLEVGKHLIDSFPRYLSRLTELEELIIQGNPFFNLISFQKLNKLKKLVTRANFMNGMDWSNLTNLKEISLGSSELRVLNESIGDLKYLEILRLGYEYFENKLAYLPDTIGNLSNLQELTIQSSELQELPETIGDLRALKKLYLKCSKLKKIPNSISKLQNLEEVHIEIESNTLPEGVFYISGVNKLKIVAHNVEKLSNDIEKLTMLKKLEIESRELRVLPKSFGNLHCLSELLIKSPLYELPSSFGYLKSLKELTLYANIRELPDNFNELESLEKLYLHTDINCNHISRLPVGIKYLRLPRIAYLPDDFGKFSLLENLEIEEINYGFTLPESIGEIVNLDIAVNNTSEHFDFSWKDIYIALKDWNSTKKINTVEGYKKHYKEYREYHYNNWRNTYHPDFDKECSKRIKKLSYVEYLKFIFLPT
ncbi:MAG: hypothetical protein KGV46_02410 [Pasteurella sp.]|nr:hypothetical protein [Pasteurella sp.]